MKRIFKFFSNVFIFVSSPKFFCLFFSKIPHFNGNSLSEAAREGNTVTVFFVYITCPLTYSRFPGDGGNLFRMDHGSLKSLYAKVWGNLIPMPSIPHSSISHRGITVFSIRHTRL